MKKKTIAVLLLCALFVVMTSGAASATETRTDTDFETALGTIEEDVYTNEYFGVGYKLPEDWVFFTDEELAQTLNAAEQVIDNEELIEMLKKAAEDGTAVTNMGAKGELGLRNVNMRLSRLTEKSLRLYSDKMILQALSTSMEAMLKKAGYENLEMEIGEVEFAGEKKAILLFSGEFMTLPIHQGEILLMGEDYYAILTFTNMIDDNIEELVGHWYALEEAEAEETEPEAAKG